MVKAFFILEADVNADWEAQVKALAEEEFILEVTRTITPFVGYLIKATAEDSYGLETITDVLRKKYNVGCHDMFIIA